MGVDVAYGCEDMIKEKVLAFTDTTPGAILGAVMILGVILGISYLLQKLT